MKIGTEVIARGERGVVVETLEEEALEMGDSPRRYVRLHPQGEWIPEEYVCRVSKNNDATAKRTLR